MTPISFLRTLAPSGVRVQHFAHQSPIPRSFSTKKENTWTCTDNFQGASRSANPLSLQELHVSQPSPMTLSRLVLDMLLIPYKDFQEPLKTLVQPRKCFETVEARFTSKEYVEAHQETCRTVTQITRSLGNQERVPIIGTSNSHNGHKTPEFAGIYNLFTTGEALYIPPHWMIDGPQTLPQELYERLQNLNTADAATEQVWIEDFAYWLSHEFLYNGSTFPSEIHQEIYHMELKVWAKAFRDPQFYQSVRAFIIGHEYGHITHHDVYYRALGDLLFQIGFIIACKAIFLPLLPFALRAVGSVLSCYQERRADAYAIRDEKTRSAAKWFFEEMEQQLELLQQRHPDLQAGKIGALWERFTKTHPSPKERITSIVQISIDEQRAS